MHAALLFPWSLAGGADLLPHLWLAEAMREAPAVRSVYPPAYHAGVALLSLAVGTGLAVQLFALGSVAALLLAFRSFQRAAGLPEAASVLFPWIPYVFALSWCVPKVEAAGYALAFVGLACVWREQRRALALVLGAAFWVHTAAALFLGLTGGVAALVRRDRRALVALAAGCVLGAPLVVTHLAAGCSLPEALLFSRGDYLRSDTGWSSFDRLDQVLLLAGPIPLAFGILGARQLVERHRAVAATAAVVVLLWANELWLAPFDTRTTLNLMRGLSILAFPIAAAAGVALASRPRVLRPVLLAAVCFALATTLFVLPDTCHRAPLDLSSLDRTLVDRCTFRWAVR